MKEKKSLQKLTTTKNKINLLMQKKKITKTDVDELLGKDDKLKFSQYLNNKLRNLKDIERDDFIEQVFEITPDSVKNQLWENNHYIITDAISLLIEESGRMPTRTQISTKTGLSRQTIGKHLKEYSTHNLYEYQKLKFNFMADRVMSKVFKIAVQDVGNVKAARLYLEVTGCLNNRQVEGTKIKTQNNYIQINGTVLSQETIQNLKPEQLNQIENILKSVQDIGN